MRAETPSASDASASASRTAPWRRICRVDGGSITSTAGAAAARSFAVWRRMIHICTIEKRLERNQ